MVGISVLESRDVAITSHIPKPVIIYPGMGIQEWKECFIHMRIKQDVIKTSCFIYGAK